MTATVSENKVAYTVAEVMQATGLGRDRVYDAIRDKKLRARKFGRRTLITRADLDAFVENLPPLELQ